MDPEGHVKLTDFGLARQGTSQGELGIVAGSAYYVAPGNSLNYTLLSDLVIGPSVILAYTFICLARIRTYSFCPDPSLFELGRGVAYEGAHLYGRLVVAGHFDL